MTAGFVIVLVLFAFGASFIQRVTGFGFGIFIMTVLPYLMTTYGEATALSGLLALVTVLITSIQKIRKVPWKKLMVILPVFLVVSFFSVRSLSGFDDRLLKHVLGCILILVSIYCFFFSSRVKMRPTVGTQLSMGAVSGLMGGFFAMQGPPAVLYFLASTGDDKEEYIAVTAWYFLIGNAFMTLYRAGSGYVTSFVGISWCIAVPAVLLGLWTGNMVYRKIPVTLLRKIVYAYMALAGVLALIS